MTRRRGVSIAVVAVVVLAGCAGLSPFGGSGGENATPTSNATGPISGTATGGGTSSDATATAGAAVSEDPGSATAGASTSTVEDGSTAVATSEGTTGNTSASGYFPPGYSATGVPDPRTAVSEWIAALNGHDSYAVAVTIPTGSSANLSVDGQVDLVNQRQHQVATASTAGRRVLHQEQYQNGSRVYAASFPTNATPQYTASTRPFSPTAATSAAGVTYGWLTNTTFGDARRVTHDGEARYRYEATQAGNPAAFLPSAAVAAGATVTDFDATLVVNSDGIVRRYEYTATYTVQGETATTTGRVRVYDLDSTTVTEPDWVDAARSNASAATAVPASRV